MASDIRKFVKGQTRNNQSVERLGIFIVFLLPSFLMDLMWIKMVFSGQPWTDFITAINIGPYFAIWGFICLITNGIFIFIILRQMKSSRDKRVAEDDSLGLEDQKSKTV